MQEFFSTSDGEDLFEFIRLDPQICLPLRRRDLPSGFAKELLSLEPNCLLSTQAGILARIPGHYTLLDLKLHPVLFFPSGSSHPQKTDSFVLRKEGKELCLTAGKDEFLYVNGKRTWRTRVHEGDWICLNGMMFWILNSWILTPFYGSSDSIRFVDLPVCETRVPVRLCEPEKPTVFSLEGFSEPSTPQTAAPFPPGMMIAGSLAGLIGGLLGPGEALKPLLTTAFGSLAGAALLFGWNFWSIRQKKQKSQISQFRQCEEYLKYLKSRAAQMEDLRQKRAGRFEQEKEKVLRLDFGLRLEASTVGWKLPAGIQEFPCFQVEIPACSWKEQAQASRKALEQLAALPSSLFGWNFWHQNEALFLEGWSSDQVLQLYLLWCWMIFQPRRRFAWIGFSAPKQIHPASRLEEELLYFPDYAAFQECKSRHPEIEWTLCSRIWISQQAQESRLFVCSEKTEDLAAKASFLGIRILPADLCFFDSEISDPLFFGKKLRSSRFFLSSSDGDSLQRPEIFYNGFSEGRSADLKAELAPGIFWDLRQDGPHALVAGATGSGKSEGMLTVLFQLAMKNPARRLQFILIDFKGGSFSAPLQDLPHTAGWISNLGPAQIGRLEQALQNELERRQSVLSEALVSHQTDRPDLEELVDPQSQDIFSHIILCVDEFGQLKTRFPNFMKFLQETARIGRSLGFHLILSTQKPAGLIDEQIWANSKSRLCFSVLDAADSREVLGHERAAFLKSSGEFFLQVSNQNEKTGRAFYLKVPADGSSELMEMQNGEFRSLPVPSLQDSWRRQILNRKEPHRWLLIPEPDPEQLQGLWTDNLRTLDPFLPEKGTLSIICGQSDHLAHLFAVLVCLWPGPAAACCSWRIHQAESWSWPSLWQLSFTECEVLILLELCSKTPSALIEALISNPNLTLVLAARSIEFRQEALLSKASLRICAGISSREQLLLFSQGRLKSEEGWPVCHLLGFDKNQRMIAGLKLPDSAVEKTLLKSSAGLPSPVILHASIGDLAGCHALRLLGIEAASFRPLFLPEQPVCLIWMDRKGKELIHSLLLRMTLEDPLCTVSNFPETGALCQADLSLCSDPLSILQPAIERGPVLFAGGGFSSWNYALQIRIPSERQGNALWIEEGKAVDIMLAGLKEEEQA